jgi:hypothetical protein
VLPQTYEAKAKAPSRVAMQSYAQAPQSRAQTTWNAIR